MVATALVGRAGPLRELCEALARPRAVILLEGEAGIGKSRLIREALTPADGDGAVPGAPVLYGSCPPLREPFPYGPVLDVLRDLDGRLAARLSPLCGVLRPYLPELADRLPPPPTAPGSPAAARHQVFRAVREVLAAAGRAVLVVEDLHWADDGTRDLLRFLVDDPPPGLSVLLSYRREELRPSGSGRGGMPLGRAYRHPPGARSTLLALGPLDVPAVRALAADLTGGAVPLHRAERLHALTAGIPFVLEELLHGIGTAPARTPVAWEALDTLPVPTLLQEAMTDRVSALSAPAMAVADAAAVLRVPAHEDVLAQVAGQDPDPAAEAIREALLAGVLHPYGGNLYGFRHGLAQQALYDSLLAPDRRRLHRRATAVLARQAQPPLVQLAYHARESGDLDAWRRYAAEAAEGARAVGDTAVAVELLESLLEEAGPDGEERARLALRLSRVAVIALNHRRSAVLLRRIVEDRSLPVATRGEIRLGLGLMLGNQAGDLEQGRAETERAVAELGDRPSLAARALAGLAMPLWGNRPLAVYEEWIARAESLVAAADGDPALAVAVRGNHLVMRLCTGDARATAEAEALLRAGGTVAMRLELARMCGNFADAACWLGLFAVAERYRREGERLADECGAPFVRGIINGTVLRLEWGTGAWHGLEERARRLLDTVESVPGIASDARLVLGLLASARGDLDEAAVHLDRAGLGDPANAPSPLLAAASGAAVRLALGRGETAAACAEADAAAARVRHKGLWAWGAELAPAAVTAWTRGGRAETARRFAADLGAALPGRDVPLAAAAHLVCRGVLDRARHEPDAAADHFRRARTAYEAMPRPYAAALATEAVGRCHGDAGRADDAAGELARAAAEFEALGAARDAARCRRALRLSGVATPSRGGRRGYGGGLSPREREVARLAGAGRTNRQIAQLLFLSPRTVEQHVAKALRKLGAASRADLAGLAGPDGD
ncbi:AAA family ATPase [Streptomyces sp. NPDC001941]|uniref:ATP-binding protein n=1 Tax=Streptomyces sp. NPDC001941 TaxID=3154659 RepID=UPI003327380C